MTKAILVAGSLHYDVVVVSPRMPAIDETLMGRAVRYIVGGKGRNQAVAVARNGVPAYMAGRVGDDQPGKLVTADLMAHGVDISLLQTGAGETTGMSVAIVNDQGEYGAVVVSGANLNFDVSRVAAPTGASLLLLQNEISEDANLVLARLARKAGVRIVLNAAPARPIASELLGLTDCLVVNRIEAEMLTGEKVTDPVSALAVARAFSSFSGNLIITLGAQGAVIRAARSRPVHQPAFPAKSVSAHGAGDFFVGSFASQIAAGANLETAVRYAQAAGSIYVATPVEERHLIRPITIRAKLEGN